jgi:hypothetical protein
MRDRGMDEPPAESFMGDSKLVRDEKDWAIRRFGEEARQENADIHTT